MRDLFRILPLLFLLASGIASAKSFSISASPSTQSVNAGQTVTFNVTVVPVDGFDASVFLRVYASTLNSASVGLAPLKLDIGTYTTGATLTVTPTKIDLGSHEVVIEGRNGGVLVYDTVTLTVAPSPGDNQWTVYHMGNSGLPAPVIRAIAFDTSGATWIGTQGGLARAEPGQEPEAVSGPYATSAINALAVDSTNTLWVLGWDETMRSVKLGRYRNGEWTNHSLAHIGDLQSSFLMAATPDGSIWFGGEGLVRFKDSVWTTYHTYNWGGGGSRISSLVVSSDGDLWGTSEWNLDERHSTVFRYDGAFWTGYKIVDLGLQADRALVTTADSNRAWIMSRTEIASPRGTDVLNRQLPPDALWLAAGRNGRIWTGSYTGAAGAMLYGSEGNSWKPYPLDSSGIGRDARIGNVHIHRNGSVWVGTSHGLAVLWAGNDSGAVSGGTSSVFAGDRSIAAAQMTITPNPLGSSGSLSLSTKGGSARITLHDNLGREVVTLFDGMLASGRQTLPIELSSVPAGAYLLSVAIEGETPSSRMIVVAR